MGKPNATVNKNVFDNPVHKEVFIFFQFVEELDWSPKNLDLYPIQNFWGELEHQLRDGHYHPTTVLDLANILLAE